VIRGDIFLRVETALIVCGGNGSRHLGYIGGFLANLSKLSTKSMEINNLSLECPVPHRAGYSSSFSWKELSNFYDPALNILIISSIPIGKQLTGI
jgi:hypothetical protein